MLAGGRGPGNPRRLRVPHSPALFLSLAAGEDPRCYATHVVGPEQSAHPTPGTRRAAQQSRGRDQQGFKSITAAAAFTQDRFPPIPTLLLNFPPPLQYLPAARRHPPCSVSPQSSPQPRHGAGRQVEKYRERSRQQLLPGGWTAGFPS